MNATQEYIDFLEDYIAKNESYLRVHWMWCSIDEVTRWEELRERIKSRFCTSEDSSGSLIWCPNWLQISSYVFNTLQKKF